jgi:TOMM system kinase/cyclase fusion protein
VPENSTTTAGSIFDGRYEIRKELGAGSSGEVFEALQLSTGQLVAIKILRLRASTDERGQRVALARFERELQICAALSHPHIVSLVDSGTVDSDLAYAVFEHVPGGTLEQLLRQQGALPLREAARLMAQTLDALAHAHASDVIHRDFKPANVMIGGPASHRNARVLDFGLGGAAEGGELQRWRSITQAREFVGTPFYASPEQLLGAPATPSSDLYSWAIVFLECVTGRHPFADMDGLSWMTGAGGVPIPAWLAKHPLGQALRLATEPNPADRRVEIEELMRALERAQVDDLAPPSQARTSAPPAGERRPLVIASCRIVVHRAPPETLEVEERDAIVSEQHRLCADIGARHGGRIVSTLGDRVLIGFGHPRVREDDASRAAIATLEMESAVQGRSRELEKQNGVSVELRVGLHAGIVVVQGSHGVGTLEALGVTAEIASDLDRAADSTDPLVSDELRQLLRGSVHAVHVEDVRLDGAAESLAAYRLLRRTSADIELLDGPIIGRDSELGQLASAWQRSREGETRLILIQGEAGIGKTRLLRELRDRVDGARCLECRCLPENRDAPLQPVIDLFMGLPERLEELLDRHALSSNPNVGLLRSLLSGEADGADVLPLSRERRKDLLLGLLVSLFVRMARDAPIVFMIEDLHWADPTTLELLTRLVQELLAAQAAGDAIEASPLIVATARPHFDSPWPEEAMPVALRRLTRPEVERMVELGLGKGNPLSSDVVETVVERADGIPLFVEQVTRMLIERGMSTGPAAMQIPTSLIGLLTARLDRLSSTAHETAQIAATLGREFPFEVLRAVVPGSEQQLRSDLDELVRSGIVLARGDEAFVFKHALMRDAAYDSMLRSARIGWHARVADTLLVDFEELIEDRPDLVARQLRDAERFAESARWWKRAGDHSASAGNYREALHQADQGLELLGRLAASEERSRLELDLTEVKGTALFSTVGYGDPQVEEVFRRAGELCEELGDGVHPRVFWGSFAVQFTRADPERTEELIPQLQRMAERSGDAVAVLSAYTQSGAARFLRGDFIGARRELEQALEQYPSEAFQRFISEIGYDPGMYTYAYLMDSMLILGDLDQSVALRSEMLEAAEREQNPYSLGVALAFATNHARELGDIETTAAMAQREIEFATEQRLFFWVAPATCALGWTALHSGQIQAGLDATQQGLAMCQAFGVNATYPFFLTGLVEAHCMMNDIPAALAAADEGLDRCKKYLDRLSESELLRHKGEALWLGGEVGDAEAHLRRSLDMARQRKARLHELRSATSLARLMRERGEPDAAREPLAAILGVLREGRETRYVVEARQLLDELG